MTTAAILQPGYLPWLGYFEQMERADVFVHMDDVPFTRKDWRSRNRIRLHDRVHWLSVPVLKRPLGTSIREMRIDYSQNWVHKHRCAIESAYRKAPNFHWIADAIFPILDDREEFLVDLDVRLALKLRECFQIETPCAFSSGLNVSSKNNVDRIIEICKAVGATRLYDGQAAKAFIDLEYFAAAGIEVEFQDYQHPLYDQGSDGFIPQLSAIDLIAHCGAQARGLLLAPDRFA
jgi:WbqC-like protein family